MTSVHHDNSVAQGLPQHDYDTPRGRLQAALDAHPQATYVRVEKIDLSAFVGELDACAEAYANNTTERDMYELLYRDIRKALEEADNDTQGAAEKGGDFSDGAEWALNRIRFAVEGNA